MDLGISALSPTVGLSGLRDPLGEATAALEARRRQQVENGRAPPWMRDIAYGIDNLFQQPLSAFIPPELRDRLPSAEMVGNLVLGALPGSGDYMAARDALESSAASMSALGRGDYMGAGARGIDALAAGLGIMPFLPYLASIKGVGNPIRAYHGSPHDFDRFDMSKIGSGEGAQAYGHGLYFAENEGVARGYRDRLSHPSMGGGLTPIPHIDGKIFEPANANINRLIEQNKHPGALVASLRKYIADYQNNPYASTDDAQKLITAIEQGKYWDGLPGRMYEVNIHADPERFLDWDKPLPTGHPARAVAEEYARVLGLNSSDPQMRNAAKDGLIALSKPEFTGQGAHNVIRDALGKDKSAKEAVANALRREAGIPGIKYLDQGSRAAGDGSRNYVVFDDKLIEILRKYGIMAPVAGAGIGSLYMSDEEGM